MSPWIEGKRKIVCQFIHETPKAVDHHDKTWECTRKGWKLKWKHLFLQCNNRHRARVMHVKFNIDQSVNSCKRMKQSITFLASVRLCRMRESTRELIITSPGWSAGSSLGSMTWAEVRKCINTTRRCSGWLKNWDIIGNYHPMLPSSRGQKGWHRCSVLRRRVTIRQLLWISLRRGKGKIMINISLWRDYEKPENYGEWDTCK